ncbi:MAG: hypothetical protein IPI89_06775 [Propionivibrio sp.]|nr:hypothetical protein [Propionivibrio sp.]
MKFQSSPPVAGGAAASGDKLAVRLGARFNPSPPLPGRSQWRLGLSHDIDPFQSSPRCPLGGAGTGGGSSRVSILAPVAGAQPCPLSHQKSRQFQSSPPLPGARSIG